MQHASQSALQTEQQKDAELEQELQAYLEEAQLASRQFGVGRSQQAPLAT